MAASCAQGGAHSDFAVAGRGARQQQVGYVGACDQQNQADRPQQDQHRRAEISGDRIRQRIDVDGPVRRIPVGHALRHALRVEPHVGAGLFESDARLQTRDHVYVLMAALIGLKLAWRELQGNVDVGRLQEL